MNKIEVIVRASSLHGEPEMIRLKERVLSDIRACGDFDFEEVRSPTGEGLVAILVLTGGVEREVLKLVSQTPSPTLLLAHPGQNSLPACLEILARIRQNGGEGRILFGSPQKISGELARELRIASAWETFRFSRVGLIGEPSEWLVASDVDRAFLKGSLGIELIKIEIDELIERIAAVRPARKDVSRFVKGAQEVNEASKDELRGSVAIYNGLRALVDEQRLAACTVRCFDLVTRIQNTGCYALSRLNDEQIPAGCEGDLQALFSLYISFLLTGKAAFMANISEIDTADRNLIIAHCSCPLSLSSGYAIRSHFESGLGVGIAANISEGPCTLFRLGGERLDRLFIRQGTIKNASHRDDLHILLPGHHQETIERFHERFLHR
jgi:L-fucose isomerase-like protein